LGRATPEVNETPERTRKRYIDAIDSVADYLEDIGADAVWAKRFDELSGALEDLVKGALQPPLTPQYRNLEGEKWVEIHEGAPQLSRGNGFGRARL
jgi:hypothetical protein